MYEKLCSCKLTNYTFLSIASNTCNRHNIVNIKHQNYSTGLSSFKYAVKSVFVYWYSHSKDNHKMLQQYRYHTYM